MKSILILMLIGWSANSILAEDEDLFDQIEQNPMKFYEKLADQAEAFYNRSRLEATKNGKMTVEEFNNQTLYLHDLLDTVYKILKGTEPAPYPEIPSPLEVFNKDNKAEIFADLLGGIKAEADRVVKDAIEQANKMEIDVNNRTRVEAIASLFYSIQRTYCNFKREIPELGRCICYDESTSYNCYQFAVDFTKKLRNNMTAAIQNIIDKMYSFPGDLNAFSQKPESDGKMMYSIFLMTRHMQTLDEAYQNLRNKLKYSEESLKEKDTDVIFELCSSEVPEKFGMVYFSRKMEECSAEVSA